MARNAWYKVFLNLQETLYVNVFEANCRRSAKRIARHEVPNTKVYRVLKMHRPKGSGMWGEAPINLERLNT